MEDLINMNIESMKTPLINNNNDLKKTAMSENNANIANGHYVAADGRVFYLCEFCNKVFTLQSARGVHVQSCPAKAYILSVENSAESAKEKGISGDARQSRKIDIQQNIILNKQLDVDDILAKSRSPPVSLTMCKTNNIGDFQLNNSLVLKEKNKSDQGLPDSARHPDTKSSRDPPTIKAVAKKTPEDIETTCGECGFEFSSPLELLRHSRQYHSYPRIIMALSEVKKFYGAKDRTQCPICHKPLKTSFRSAFLKHLHTHTNEMSFSCKVCNKKFRRSDHMKAHEKRHIVKVKNE